MTSILDYQAIAALCKAKLDLISAIAGDDWYQSLPLCVIDTVFSIGARYTSTRNTVLRFCTYFGLQCFTKNNRPSIENQFSLTSFIDLYAQGQRTLIPAINDALSDYMCVSRILTLLRLNSNTPLK